MPTTSSIERMISVLSKRLSLGSVLTIISVLGTGYGFYYGTNNKLDAHTEAIKTTNERQARIESEMVTTKVFQSTTTVELSAIKEKAISMEKSMDKIDNKLDRVLIQTR